MESDLGASQVFKFLTSKDPKVVMMYARRLRDTIAARKADKDVDPDETLELPHHLAEEEHRKSNNSKVTV